MREFKKIYILLTQSLLQSTSQPIDFGPVIRLIRFSFSTNVLNTKLGRRLKRGETSCKILKTLLTCYCQWMEGGGGVRFEPVLVSFQVIKSLERSF